MYTITDLYDLEHTLAKDYLSQFTYPWEALKGIKDFILALGPTLGDDYEEVAENVWVPRPRSDTARSSEARRLSAQTALSATPWN